MEPIVAIILVSIGLAFFVLIRLGRGKRRQPTLPPQPEVCAQTGRVIGDCEFEPRYDFGGSKAELTNINPEYLEQYSELADKYRTQTYVRDICVRCGRTSERVLGVRAGAQLENSEPV